VGRRYDPLLVDDPSEPVSLAELGRSLPVPVLETAEGAKALNLCAVGSLPPNAFGGSAREARTREMLAEEHKALVAALPQKQMALAAREVAGLLMRAAGLAHGLQGGKVAVAAAEAAQAGSGDGLVGLELGLVELWLGDFVDRLGAWALGGSAHAQAMDDLVAACLGGLEPIPVGNAGIDEGGGWVEGPSVMRFEGEEEIDGTNLP